MRWTARRVHCRRLERWIEPERSAAGSGRRGARLHDDGMGAKAYPAATPAAMFALSNIERAEVAGDLQGTMPGRNSIGGAIRTKFTGIGDLRAVARAPKAIDTDKSRAR